MESIIFSVILLSHKPTLYCFFFLILNHEFIFNQTVDFFSAHLTVIPISKSFFKIYNYLGFLKEHHIKQCHTFIKLDNDKMMSEDHTDSCQVNYQSCVC